MISNRPQYIAIEPRLLRPLVESEGRITRLGTAHETVQREIQRGRVELYPQTPVAFDPRKKQIYGAYDSVYPRYGFSVGARPLTSRMVLKGRFSLDF